MESNVPAAAGSRRPARRRLWLLGLLAAGLGWVAVPGGIRIGGGPSLDRLAAATLTSSQGDPVRLVALAAGRPVVVNLWASWCGPCRAEMPLLAAAQRREPGIVFVFANQGEDVFTVQHYLDTNVPALANVLLDPARTMGQKAGSAALPTTLFFDATGRLDSSHQGALSAQMLGKRLEPLRAAGQAMAP